MRIPFSLHRRIPLVRRPFWQRDQARAQLASVRAERDALRTTLSDPLRGLPWYGIDEVPNVPSGRGMVHPDERRLLYVLARDHFRGEGRIIDGGTYLGSSSLALGLGLRDRGYPARPVIDAFDQFTIDANSVANYLDPSIDTVAPGNNIRHLYDRNITPVAEYISVHEGDVTASPWSGDPIEILFCDISKSWQINDYIITNWMTCLTPGKSILIQQDQVQEHHVWVAITMEMLSEHFEIIDFTPHSTMVYRPVGVLSAEAIRRALSANVTFDDMERAYRSWIARFRRTAMGRYKGWHLGMVEAGLVVTYGFHIGDRDRAFHHLRECENTFRDVPDTMGRLKAIRHHLEDGTWCPGGITIPR